MPPFQKKKSGKYFAGNYHVKFGNFVNFSGKYHKNSVILIIFGGKYHVKFGHIVNFSCTIFGQKYLAPKLTELLRLRLPEPVAESEEISFHDVIQVQWD